ncbi:MAG TPA: ABC transporter ATP-binding protein [Steroidobacteraceae bacterium]|nr:ABC transporter ATP-binding protein [Steroidobacteraceae bacterium]
MSESLVTTRSLGKRFGNKSVLHDISLSVAPGSVVGIIGKNGAGKTTLLEILLGFSPASNGRAELFGEDSFALSSASKTRIGFVPQQDELINLLTGRQQLALIAALRGRWNAPLIERLQEIWEVPLDRLIQSLSGGERQKLSTLAALGHDPDLLVLDEPVASLDPIARRRFLQEMIALTQERTRTVLFSTHIVSDLERIADQIWILRGGTIAWAGPLDVLQESVVRLNITARQPLPRELPLSGCLSQQVAGVRASAVVSNWNAQLQGQLQEQFAAEIQVEPLGLEDIFVEFHT